MIRGEYLHAPLFPPYSILKLLALPSTVLMKLLEILDTLLWRTKG